MASERLLVIGGVAAGMSAASRARKLNPRMEITVLEKGPDVSYGACGLPYYVAGRVREASDLVVYDAEFFRSKREIDVRLEHEATVIEPGRKRVLALHRGTTPVELPYDKLVIATGGAPAATLTGYDLPNVFTGTTLSDAVRLRAHLESLPSGSPKRAVIIGSGYIGLEMAEAFAAHRCRVTVLERSASILEGLEPAIAELVEGELSRNGVTVLKSEPASRIDEGEQGSARVHYGTGKCLPAEVVLLSTGIRPRVELASAAGIAIGPSGAIAVDERMHTSVQSIYAAGDCAEVHNLVTGRPDYFPLGTTANKQGRVAGENAAGGNSTFSGVVGTLVTKVFDLEIGRTGLTAEQARRHGFQPNTVLINAVSRAQYFGGQKLRVALVWDRSDGRLLGYQMAGGEGVAKRIDVAAMALHARLRLHEMRDLDLSYAPPFATVWDPLLVAVNEALKKQSGRS